MLADITGGFGIDSYYFSKNFNTVHHFEKNALLSKISSHNFKILKTNNIQCFSEDGILAIREKKYDVIYADPSRRNKSKKKVFLLNNCKPNIPEIVDQLLINCKTLLIKTSPMLDISIGIDELAYVKEIHIVAVKNEVKELLWLLKPNYKKTITIKTLNFLSQKTQAFDFILGSRSKTIYEHPKKYLFEPNTAILKSGAFDLLSSTYKVSKLQKNSHLFTCEQLVEFPGRRFKIEQVVPYSKKEIRKAITFTKANITTRNFPETVDTLRKKWKIKDGGDVYLFFTTLENLQKVMLICSSVKK